LGLGDWPNPPIPNPQSPIPTKLSQNKNLKYKINKI